MRFALLLLVCSDLSSGITLRRELDEWSGSPHFAELVKKQLGDEVEERRENLTLGPYCESSIQLLIKARNGHNTTKFTCARPILGPKHRHSWSNRLLVIPQLKFAFCAIEKNACTQFNGLIDHLNGMMGQELPPLLSSHEAMGINLAEITAERGWRKAVFLRDPMERFVSAWRSKCAVWEDRGDNCLGGRRADNGSIIESFERMVREDYPKYQQIRDQQWNGTWNAHFDPQSRFCGGAGLADFDYIGLLGQNTSSVHAQVVDMLRRVARATPNMLNKGSVDRFFPRNAIHGHHARRGSGSVDRYYRDPQVRRMVQESFLDDFELMPDRHGSA